MKLSMAACLPFQQEVCIDRILNRVRAGVTVRRVIAPGPRRQRKGELEPAWCTVTANTSMPASGALVEVQYASGGTATGRAGDFLWNLPSRAAGRIARFRVLDEEV